jgi:hypothetical protein
MRNEAVLHAGIRVAQPVEVVGQVGHSLVEGALDSRM